MYNLSKNLPLLTSLMAKGVASCAVGDGFTATTTLASVGLTIAKAFAPDVTEHIVSVLDYSRFKEFLIKTHPGDLNHDLDKLIKDALIRTVGFIKRLYLDKLKEEYELTLWQTFKQPFAVIEDVLATMERDLKAQLASTTFQQEDLEKYLTGEHANCLDQLTHYLFSVSGVDESDVEWQKLRTFFREQLPLLFDLSYKEALKDEGNAKAFKAFEIWILEEGLKNQKELVAGQVRILAELETLKTGRFSQSHEAALQQLEADVQRIPVLLLEKLDILIAQLTRIETTVNRTEGKVDQVITILESGKLVQRIIPRQLTPIPALGSDFVGRQEEIKLLRNALQSSTKVILMNGLGGIGKTTLAKRFVQLHQTAYDHICWIDVTKQDTVINGKLLSGSIQEALADYVLLFKNLGVTYNPKEESVEERFAQITNALANLTGHNLLVIDNAGSDAGDKAIRNLLPRPPHWQVLLTSRQQLAGYTVLPLDRLDEQAAKELFYSHYTYDCTPEEVTNLMVAIDFHTLTVELFAKTLEEHHGTLTVRDLLDKVNRKTLNDNALQRTIETEHHPEETEVFLHLMLAFDCMELTSDEKRVLSQFALLPPESYTVKEHLAPWLGYADPAQQRVLDEALRQLIKKGWLNQVNHSYSLHRLLQQVISYQLPFNWNEAKTLVESITGVLETVDNPNALAVYPLKKYGEFLIANIPEIGQDKPEVSSLKTNLALVYQDLGFFQQAASLLEEALKSDQIHSSRNHPLIATRQSNLALVYQDLGRYEQAASLLEEALKSDQIHSSRNHPLIAKRQSNLALVYQDLGRYEQAASLLEEALKSDQIHSSRNHPLIATRQSNLALVYQNLGRYEQAASLLEEALKSDQIHFSKDHPLIATRQSSLALVYRNLGRYEQAGHLLIAALKSAHIHFGKGHPLIATRQSNLALVYQDLGRYEQAASLLEEALKSDQTNFGKDHPLIATRQLNLATVFLEVDRIDEAIGLLQNAELVYVRQLGEHHPHTKNCRSWLEYAKSKR